jgi:prepilin-type N-terminal cleavage/methylation domain-containing protein
MNSLRSNLRAFTLAEVMVTSAVMSLVLAAVTAAVWSLQRSFAASQSFVVSHLEQVRTLDSLKRDARCAKAAEVRANGSCVVFTITTGQPGLLSLELPATVVDLLMPNGSAAATTKTVTYNFANQRITRSEGSTVKTVATRQTKFQVQQNGSQLSTTLAFPSRFSNQTVETPTTTLSQSLSYRANNW